MRGLAFCLAVCLVGQGAWAEAPATSLRPMPRPMEQTPTEQAPPVATATDLAATATLRPKRRPDASATAPALPETAPKAATSVAAVPMTRPKPRPAGLAATLASAPMAEAVPEQSQPKGKKKEKASRKGSVCGDPDIKGETLAPIAGKVKGCGLDAPVRVTSVSGIRLNQPATISCETASALKTWVENGLRPAMGGREVVEIRIAASYICRPRNNKKGAKISEHGRGKAVDVVGFVFSDGKQWSVAGDYNKQVRRAHKAACGIFGTTLGPGSDGYHEDNLHYDIASYRGGPYCK